MKNSIQNKINDLLILDNDIAHQVLLENLEFATSGERSREELEENFFQENDPCDTEGMYAFTDDVRNIQHEIINYYAV